MAIKRIRQQTITQQIMTEAAMELQKIPHDLTRKQYTKNFKRYIYFCRKNYAVKSLVDCVNYTQDYSDFLQKNLYSASTIHAYLTAVCKVLNIKMSTIKKPIRHTSEYTRGRTEKEYPRAYEDINDPRWSYLVNFQKRVGIRKNELRNLTGDCFVRDESRYYCILVKHGKGGKRQLQRLNPLDVPFIMQYFKGKSPADKIFSDDLLSNRLNLHSLRAENAKSCYQQVLHRIEHEEGYAEKAIAECRARWQLYNLNPKTGKPRPFPKKEFLGKYVLRGKNRKLAMTKHLPVKYNRLALMYCSIFVLSHWRCDVTIASYILA